MKTLFHFMFVLIGINTGLAQNVKHCPLDTTIVRIPEFYKGYGKVFPSTSLANRQFDGRQFSGPMFEDFRRDIELNDFDLIEIEKRLKGIGEFRFVKWDRLKKYYRQYVSYENNVGDHIVIVLLMNFKKKRVANKQFKLWTKVFALGAGDWFYKNQFLIGVNLTKGMLLYPYRAG